MTKQCAKGWTFCSRGEFKLGFVAFWVKTQSSVVQFPDGTLGVQWDDAHLGPVLHAALANETFVRLKLARRP